MPPRRRVVGTAGHIDHGKTSLIRALTGIDTDRLPEEKRRGITIDLGFASWITDDYQIGFVDVPGHERFVRNMLAGIGGIDSVMLVIAADESIKPQTREHFAICRLLKVPSGLVALTKSDLVESDIIDLVRLEVEDLVRGSFLDGAPIVPVSSATGAGLDDLRSAILSSVSGNEDRDSRTRVFRMPIDRAFTMKGFGTVVTGTTYSGHMDIDRDVEILPSESHSRARNIQVHGGARPTTSAGERTSLNLPDIPLDEVHRGQQAVAPDTLRASFIITAEIELLADSKPLKQQTRIRFHHLAAERLGTIRFIDDTGETLEAGRHAYVQIHLEEPVVAVDGDRFVIRRYSPAVTIGGGAVIGAHLPKLSRRTRPELLRTLSHGSFAERVEISARMAGLRGLSLADLQMRTGLTSDALLQEVKEMPALADIGERRWLHREVLADFRRSAMRFLSGYFDRNTTALNVPKGEFVQKTLPPDADGGLINYLLQDLAREKIVTIQGDALDIPGRSKILGGAEGEVARAIAGRFAQDGLHPPAVSELIRTIAQKPKVIEGLVSYLVKNDTLIRLGEGIYIHRDAVEEAAGILRQRSGQSIEIGAFKELFGLSRKIAIPLLEWFDRKGVTKRTGDMREIL